MKRTKAIGFYLGLVLVMLAVSSCMTAPKEGFRIYFDQIEVGVTYSNEEITAEGDNYYRFTPPSSGVYVIGVTDVDSELSWELHDKARGAYMLSFRSIIAACENWGAVDQVGKTGMLKGGQ